MSKFNRATTTVAASNGPVVTTTEPGVLTHEGSPAYARDTQSELFMLAVSNLVGEDTFYESAADRDARFARLVRAVAVADVDWLTRFIPWLRRTAHMRSAPLVAAAEAVHARLEAGLHGGNRALISGACERADEVGELLAYWWKTFGRALPKPVKRGLGDAALRLYDEYRLLKYDTPSHGVRFADVLELTHPGRAQVARADKAALIEHALDRRHGRRTGDKATAALARLPMVTANAELRALAGEDPRKLLDPGRLKTAGMTWEAVDSLIGSKVPKAQMWAALIPVMGIFALLRHLREFDQEKVPDAAVQLVLDRFTNPGQVARSGIFPYQWLAAYNEAPSLRWGHALDQAMTASLANLPALDGRTLVLVDTSGSMTSMGLSAKSKMRPVDAAAVFGVALAARGEADLYGFADGTFAHELPAGASVIAEVRRFAARVGEVGHGTMMAAAVRARFRPGVHRRVVLISDEQSHDRGVGDHLPSDVPLYCVNLGGYRPAAARWGASNRIELGGLSDATFRFIPLVEAGRRADWDAVFTTA